LLIKMGLGLASFPRLILVTLSSVSDLRCSKLVSQRVFRYLIQESIFDWIISSSPSSGCLVETMFTKSSLKILPTLTYDSYDDVIDE